MEDLNLPYHIKYIHSHKNRNYSTLKKPSKIELIHEQS